MQFPAPALSEAAGLNLEYCVRKEGPDTQPSTGAEEVVRIRISKDSKDMSWGGGGATVMPSCD